MKSLPVKILLSILALSSSFIVHAGDDTYSGPDFTAKKVTVDGSDKTVSQIHMSKKGFREEMLTNVRQKIIYISNYKKKKVWMVVPSKKLYSNMETMPGNEYSTFAKSTLFDDKPCKGFNKTKRLAIKNIAKQNIEEWGCINKKDNRAVLQWYNPKTKMVIREKDKVSNASDIKISHVKFKSQSDHLFSVPSGYKKVPMSEMMKLMQN